MGRQLTLSEPIRLHAKSWTKALGPSCRSRRNNRYLLISFDADGRGLGHCWSRGRAAHGAATSAQPQGYSDFKKGIDEAGVTILRQSRRLLGDLLAPQRGRTQSLNTGSTEAESLARNFPGRLELLSRHRQQLTRAAEPHSRKRQTPAATPAKPGDLLCLFSAMHVRSPPWLQGYRLVQVLEECA